jgi:hypothetical protein
MQKLGPKAEKKITRATKANLIFWEGKYASIPSLSLLFNSK